MGPVTILDIQALEEKMTEYFEYEIDLVNAPGITLIMRTHEQQHGDDTLGGLIWQLKGTREDVKKFAPNGIVYLGINGGRFDDHVNGVINGEKKKSCSDLVADALGINDSKVWEKLLAHVSLNDRDGSQDLRDITSLYKIMNRQDPDNQDEHIKWYMDCIHAKFYDYVNDDFTIDHIKDFTKGKSMMCQKIRSEVNVKWLYKKGDKAFKLHKLYFKQACKEIEHKLKIGEIFTKSAYVLNGNGKKKRIVIAAYQMDEFDGIRDNYRMEAALRANSRYGGVLGADVFVMRNSKGQTMIGQAGRVPINFDDTIAILRLSEQLVRKYIKVDDQKFLRLGGTLRKVPQWHYDRLRKISLIYNGTLSHPDVEPSKLSLMQIFEAVILSLDPQAFNPKYQDNCRRGICLGKESCMLLACGFKKCVTRWQYTNREMAKKQKKGGIKLAKVAA